MRKTKQQKAPSSEQQQGEQSHSQNEEDEESDEQNQDDYLADDEAAEPNQEERDQELLRRITQQAKTQTPELELTWNAIWNFKNEEIKLKKNMNQEIQKIKNKYEMLKQPLYQQISSVALGRKVDSKLYKPEGLPCRGDPTKIAPLPIKDFWGQILDKEGLMTDEIDVQCFSKIKEITCQLINLQFNQIRVNFTFKEQTQYFSNKSLEVTVKFDQEKHPVRQIKQELKYKKVQRKQASIFTLLFDAKTNIEDTFSCAQELYQVYSNCLYFYFLQESADEQEGKQQSQDESEDVQAVKPGKKVKGNEKKEIEKPQCKNQ